MKFRFLFCIHMIKNIPEDIEDDDDLYFKYDFMGQSNKVVLDFKQKQDDRVFMEFTKL